MTKPRLGVFKFASCDGCQLSLLDAEDHLLEVVFWGRQVGETKAEWLVSRTRLKSRVSVPWPETEWEPWNKACRRSLT